MALAALCGDDEWGETWAQRAPAPLRGHRRDARPRRRQPADRQPLGAARRPRRGPRLGRPAPRRARAGCCRWRSRRSTSPPRSAASTPTTPTRSPRCAARWRWRPPTAPSSRSRCCPTTCALPRGRRRRPRRRPGGARPGLVVHLRAAPPDGPVAATRPWWRPTATWSSSSTWRPRTARPTGYAAADHLAVLLDHAPDLPVGTVLVDRSETVGGTSPSSRRWPTSAAPGSSSPTSPDDDGTPRHDPRSSPRRTPRSWPDSDRTRRPPRRSTLAPHGVVDGVAGSAPWR